MLTQPPGEALTRTSTFTLSSDRPGWIDLTTVYTQPWTSSTRESLIDGKSMNEGTSDSSKSASANITSRPVHTKAIYEIVGHRMTYCVAGTGRPRPTEFLTKKGDGCTLVSLELEIASGNPMRPFIPPYAMDFPSPPSATDE
jgi:hypothetical protein